MNTNFWFSPRNLSNKSSIISRIGRSGAPDSHRGTLQSFNELAAAQGKGLSMAYGVTGILLGISYIAFRTINHYKQKRIDEEHQQHQHTASPA